MTKESNRTLPMLAQTPTPFQVTIPFTDLKFSSSRLNKFTPLCSMEGYDVQNPVPSSYLFIAKAVHCLGSATPVLIQGLVRYMYYTEKKKAAREHRDRLCIPNLSLDEVRTALKTLTKYGILYKFRFQCPGNDSGDEGEWFSVYKASANGIRLYKRKLEDREIYYNETDAFMPAWEMFTNIHTGYMHYGLLPSPFLRKVQYSYTRCDERKKKIVTYPIRMIFNVNGDAANDDHSNDVIAILCSYTFKVNTSIVTEECHYEKVKQSIQRVIQGMYYERAEHPAFLLICCDEMKSLTEITQIIQDIDPSVLTYTLFTTGNILVTKLAVGDTREIANCFIRFNQSTGKFKPVTQKDGYIFLEMASGGVFSYGIKNKGELVEEQEDIKEEASDEIMSDEDISEETEMQNY